MMFLFIVALGAACGFYLALLIDRPDLLAAVTQQQQQMLQAGFAILLLLVLARLSWPQIRDGQRGFSHVFNILMRNLLVLVAGVVLLAFVGRMLLDGLDHTHHHALW